MPIITNYPITLDVQEVLSQVSIPVPQDKARRISATLTENGSPLYLPDGCRAVFSATKADGTTVNNDCIIEHNSVVRYDFTEQTTAAVGKVECCFKVYGLEGEYLYGPIFTLVVYENKSGDVIFSEDEKNFLDRIFAAEESRISAELLRDDAERARREAETSRASAEQERAAAEVARQTALVDNLTTDDPGKYLSARMGKKLNEEKVPTTRKVNKKHLSSDIDLTASDVGAAPADTGLWYKRQLTADDDMNALLENGIYTYSTSSLPANCPYENAGVVMVFGSTSATTQRIQFVFRYGTAGQGKFRAYYDSWKEWSDFGGLIESASHPGCYYRQIGSATEWEDPTMVVGNEYRTTERWNGKPVYIKAVDCGAMPAAGNHKNIKIVTGLTANHYVLDMKCIFTSNIGGDYNLIRRTVNYCTDVENTTGEITGLAWAFSTTGSSSYISVTIKAIKDISNNTAIAIVKYTK